MEKFHYEGRTEIMRMDSQNSEKKEEKSRCTFYHHHYHLKIIDKANPLRFSSFITHNKLIAGKIKKFMIKYRVLG